MAQAQAQQPMKTLVATTGAGSKLIVYQALKEANEQQQRILRAS